MIKPLIVLVIFAGSPSLAQGLVPPANFEAITEKYMRCAHDKSVKYYSQYASAGFIADIIMKECEADEKAYDDVLGGYRYDGEKPPMEILNLMRENMHLTTRKNSIATIFKMRDAEGK